MLYFTRDASGKITTYVGSIDASGKESIISPTGVHSTVLGTWKSQATGISYPSGWQLEVHDSQLQVSLTITPLLKNQELVVTQSTGDIYWEGAVSIEGQSNGQSVSGEGYVELTGYVN